jgi:hypothetical protein
MPKKPVARNKTDAKMIILQYMTTSFWLFLLGLASSPLPAQPVDPLLLARDQAC